LPVQLSDRYVEVIVSLRGISQRVSVLRSSPVPVRSVGFAACLLLVSLLVTGCAGYSPQGPPKVGVLSVSASAFNFQTVVVGQTSAQTLQVSNTGTAPLQITGLSVSNKEFTISGPSIPRVVLPANSLSYTLTFTPTASGSASADLTISTATSGVSTSVSLAGIGEKAFADLVITPASISFGNLTLTTKGTQNVTLQNTGDINLTVQGVTLVGAGFGYASLSPGFSLAPNQKLTFQVWFSPTVAGPASGQVSFLSPNLSSPETLSLSGTGVTSTVSSPTPAVQHTVHLAWDASSSQVIGYRVYRSEISGGSYSSLNGTALNLLTYDDSTVSLGTTYYYVVTAVDASGNESVYSNQVTAVIPTS
jgi:hypothetical protein